MKVDAERVMELRKEQSWSQEELAIAAGLNLRTIQRIESDGSASLQSKKALASAFNIEVRELDYKERPLIMKYEYKVLRFDIKGIMGGKIDSLDIEKQLNEFGAEGWELARTENVLVDSGCSKMILAFLKRPLA